MIASEMSAARSKTLRGSLTRRSRGILPLIPLAEVLLADRWLELVQASFIDSSVSVATSRQPIEGSVRQLFSSNCPNRQGMLLVSKHQDQGTERAP